MARRTEQLSAQFVRHAKPGRYGDGGGLYLLVRPNRTKFWLFRYTLRGGKRREMGLGSAGENGVSLKDARKRAAKQRGLVNDGIDPLARRQADRVERTAAATAEHVRRRTFARVADEYLAVHDDSWRNDKHRSQWRKTLHNYANPVLGDIPVSDIETAHLVEVLTPLWNSRTETASRLRGRIEAVLDYAAVHGWRDGANPARWRGHLDKVFPKPSRISPVEHHAAMPWHDVPAFMGQLHDQGGVAAGLLRFVILTAARSSEGREARWSEIDLDQALWTIPGSRMKAGREHRVPLSPSAIAVVEGQSPQSAGPDSFVFPGQRRGRPLSNMTMAMLMRRMGHGDVTVHGFRSAFRDWAGETTGTPREVVEMALAHRLGDKAEQAYARGDLFTKRRVLMDAWDVYCVTQDDRVTRLPERMSSLESRRGKL